MALARVLSKAEGLELTPAQIDEIITGGGNTLKVGLVPYARVYTAPSFRALCSASSGLQAIILFIETDGAQEGHYCGIWWNDSTIFYFDSYGLQADSEYSYSSWLKKTYPQGPGLGKLLQADGRTVVSNQTPYQSWKRNVSTCGRWVALRLRLVRELPTHESFAAFFHNTAGVNVTPDQLVTMLTFLSVPSDIIFT